MARAGKEAVAFVILKPAHVGAWYLARAGTDPAHAGRGLYKRLLRAAEAAARRAGVYEIVTDTAHWNVASANGLIGAGFRLYVPNKRWAFEDGLYWRKQLLCLTSSNASSPTA